MFSSLTDAGGTTSLSYDALSRISSENIAGYGAISYAYDPAGNRTSKTEPANTGGPALALSVGRVYWASYQDWQNHELSTDYTITDNGPGTASAAKVTGAAATSGVYLLSAAPLSIVDPQNETVG